MPKLSSGRPGFRRLYAVAALLILSGCAQAVKAPDASKEGWGTFLYNGSRSNSTVEEVGLPLGEEWRSNIGPVKIIRVFPKEQFSSPVIAGGVLYAGSTSGKFYAFDLETGSVLWKFNSGAPVEAPATVSGDSVCFGNSSGTMRCLERATGKERWSFQARSEILSAPLIMDGLVYFTSSDDRAYALSLEKGEKVWSYARGVFKSVSRRFRVSQAVHGKNVIQLFSDGYLVSLSSDTGREAWSRKVLKDPDASERGRRTPLVIDGTVYLIDDTGSIVGLSASSGDIVGIYSVIKARDFIAPDRRTLVIAGADRVLAMDRMTGAILWKTDLPYPEVSTVFAASGRIFVLTNHTSAPLGIKLFSRTKGYIQALSLSNGEGLWTRRLGFTVTANGSTAENRVALLNDRGDLTVYSPK